MATVVHIRVTLGHLRVIKGHFLSISKHKANTTELHPKVRQTCLYVSMRLSAVAYSYPAPRPGHKLGIISSHLLNRRGGDPGVTRMCQERGRGAQEE